MAISLTGSSPDRFSRWRSLHPVRFAAAVQAKEPEIR